jgi:gluconolactonase
VRAEVSTVLSPAPRPERLAEVDAHEGPVYVQDEDALYFTTPRRPEGVAVRRLDLGTGRASTVREDANMANGMALDLEGRLLVCEQGTFAEPARVTRLDRRTGVWETVVDSFFGLPFNSPNDVVAGSDGTIWFTDPSYGWLQGFRPKPRVGDCVYRVDPRTGSVSIAADSLDKPNGLAFSPDESVLYVGDSGAIHGPDDYDPRRPRRVLAFDVAGGRLENERVFVDEIPGFPDGIKVDALGRVYVSSAGGILIFDGEGSAAGSITIPGAVNFAFGGPDGDLLFITTDTAVWAARTTKGA